MEDDVKKIGDQLRLRREEMGITVKEVENSTSIRESYIEAIEKGMSDKFLTNVYMYGFMRQYAGFLGLDMDKLSEEYPAFFQTPNLKHDFQYGIGTLEVRGNVSGGVRWYPNVLYAGATVAVILAAFYLIRYLGLV